jgi:hypothetical protein
MKEIEREKRKGDRGQKEIKKDRDEERNKKLN